MDVAGCLIVEDDPSAGRWLVRSLKKVCPTRLAVSIAAAKVALEEGTYQAMVVDIGLPDGSGIDLVRFVKKHNPSMPILILTGSEQAAHVNSAFSLGVAYAVKPVEMPHLLAFVKRAFQKNADADGRLARAMASWAIHYDLTTIETQLLTLAAEGATADEVAERRGTSPNTVKTQIAALLHKTGDRTLQRAANRVLRDSGKS